MKISRRYPKIFFALSAIILIAVNFSFFGQAKALTVSPVKLELAGDPGQTITGSFELLNEQNANITFYTSYANFEAQGETGTPNFIVSPEGLDTWIKAPDKIDLAANEKKTVSFTIDIPKNADPGGHFAAIFFGTAPAAAQAGSSQVSIGAKVGILTLLNVSGAVKQGAGIIEFGIDNIKGLITKLPLSFYYRFQNSGGDRVNPDGQIVIKNMFGSQVAVLAANPSHGNVLPGSIRKFHVLWSDDPNIQAEDFLAGKQPLALSQNGLAGFFAAAQSELKDFRFGVYSAILDLHSGTNASGTQLKHAFLIFPWQLLLLALVILTLLGYILKKIIKGYNKWIISKANKA